MLISKIVSCCLLVQNHSHCHECDGDRCNDFCSRRKPTARFSRSQQGRNRSRGRLGHDVASFLFDLHFPLPDLRHHHGLVPRWLAILQNTQRHLWSCLHGASGASDCSHLQFEEQGEFEDYKICVLLTKVN